ncbi:MAG: hypothetical protein KAW41_01345 [Candidatus Diapherotrites archaeon]|nr:hypothetical protein [Candidatus Diapherotrites archaeon]
MVDRVPTGIEGLDEMLGGGFLKKRHVMVVGGPGTGKTTFGLEFLYRGALLGDKGLMVLLEEKPEKLIENMSQGLDWKLQEQVDNGSIVLVSVDCFNWERLSDTLQAYVTRHNVNRVVIDTLTLLKMNTEDPFEFRRNIVGLIGFLEGLDCTVLFTAEAPYATREGAEYSLEEFMVDGVISLYNIPIKNERRRALEVVKMRGVRHSNAMYPFKITKSGIVVYREEII